MMILLNVGSPWMKTKRGGISRSSRSVRRYGRASGFGHVRPLISIVSRAAKSGASFGMCARRASGLSTYISRTARRLTGATSRAWRLARVSMIAWRWSAVGLISSGCPPLQSVECYDAIQVLPKSQSHPKTAPIGFGIPLCLIVEQLSGCRRLRPLDDSLLAHLHAVEPPRRRLGVPVVAQRLRGAVFADAGNIRQVSHPHAWRLHEPSTNSPFFGHADR